MIQARKAVGAVVLLGVLATMAGAWLIIASNGTPEGNGVLTESSGLTSTESSPDFAVADVETAEISTTDLQETPDPPDQVAAPRLDLVRIDGTGSAVVAGAATADAQVVLMLDGQEIAATRSDSSGNFVSLFDIAPSDSPRILTVETRNDTGQTTRARESVIVAPMLLTPPAPEVAPTIASSDIQSNEAITDVQTETELAFKADENLVGPSPTKTPQTDIPEGSDLADGDGETADPPPPRLFRAGPAGVAVLEPADIAPVVSQDLGIDAITYSEIGEVQLAGRGVRDSDLQIYLDNKPIQLARVDKDGTWALDLPEIDVGVYTLRVDALNDDGTVASRVETPFQRTAPEVAAASRRDGITAITVQPGYTLWAISEGYFGDGVQYVQIFERNRDQIIDPDLIFPGQVFDLPEAQ